MKNKFLIALAILFIISLFGCNNPTTSFQNPYESFVVFTSSTEGGVMLVFYIIEDEQYLFWCDESATIIDNGDTWDVISDQHIARGVNKATVTYDVFKYKPIEPVYNDEGNPITLYLSDLNLESPTANDLPHSEHIGKLMAVNATAARPATVRRKFMGTTYDVNCLVTQEVKDEYQAGKIQLGDYVIVSFIDEIPDTEEVNIAIVTGKVFESWD